MLSLLRFFIYSLLITLAAIVIAYFKLGWAAVYTTIILIAIEIAFSFDNAIINAKVLERLSRFWQQLFLTVGMVFAIIGMRLVFPILIVMITADLSWSQVIDEALHNPSAYGEHLEEAHIPIAAFGGAFLMTLTLYFLFDEARDILWLHKIERPLQRLRGGSWLAPATSAIIILLIAIFAGAEQSTVIQAGIFGTFAYTAIKLFIDSLGKLAPTSQKIYTGWAAFGAFIYLQLLDASFSFDGVLGAFAITDKVLLIALGLGVGAIWVRSLTVYLVRQGTLNSYKYLEHGAHYAILVLAFALFASIFITVPDVITGIIGIGVILASFISSREARLAKKVNQV